MATYRELGRTLSGMATQVAYDLRFYPSSPAGSTESAAGWCAGRRAMALRGNGLRIGPGVGRRFRRV